MTTNMSFRLLNVIIGLVSAILLSPRAALAETPLDISTPKNVKVSALLQPDGAKPSAASIAAAFDIDPDGLPAIADGTALKLIGTSQEMLSLGVLPIDDFAWMRDGKLLLITQSHLASLSPKGVVLSLELPTAGMRLRPAGNNTAYIFGGTSEPTNHTVYLFARDQTVTKLASLPSPVTAVAGDGTTTYIASDKTILRTAWNQPPRLLLETRDPLISLEVAPHEGLFYATKSSVGYIDRNGDASEFLRGEGGSLRLRGSTLFVLLPSGNLLRFGPVEAFEQR